MALITSNSIPQPDWTCKNYIDWYKILKKDLGQDLALQVFDAGWTEEGSTSCQFNDDFVSFFDKEGYDVSNGLIRTVTSVWGSAQKFVKGTFSAIGVTGSLLPVVIVFTVGMAGWLIYKTVKETSGKDVAKAAASAKGMKRMK